MHLFRHPLLLLSATLLLALSTPLVLAKEARASSASAPSTPPVATPAKSGYVPVNGVDYHYQIHGQGAPLLLLHGGLGSTGMFGPVLAALARTRQVIGVDLQGHGRTALGGRDISLVDMGDDLAVLLKHLGLQQVDVMGYSMGAGVAFRLAVQHPERVRRLVLVSAGYAQDGFFPEILQMQAQVGAGMAEAMKPTPMYQSYAAIAPRPQDFPLLLDRMGALMRKPYDWSADVQRLAMPVMLVYGDSDMFRPEHMVKFYQLLGGGLRDAGWQREHMSRNRLAILPGLTHYDIFLSPALASTALSFLDDRQPPQTWVAQPGTAP
ncbi:alpha/beta fold hydrolase [Chitiniphilus purpureus]|uniref:Alpha/beta fold hydrolase n=1 Tax=Chitiniphilus purpureus TaxID=2981137 RepID=A0ABY6DS62_9NEIS|nr:alpha/beta fold hydrolase [Chitiniphilus sp. CD1]UXY17220.1 alpha/beta fold hydrolase [Chitiniphilus sp. CD1]